MTPLATGQLHSGSHQPWTRDSETSTLPGFHQPASYLVVVAEEQATNNSEDKNIYQHHIDLTFPSHQADCERGCKNQAAHVRRMNKRDVVQQVYPGDVLSGASGDG